MTEPMPSWVKLFALAAVVEPIMTSLVMFWGQMSGLGPDYLPLDTQTGINHILTYKMAYMIREGWYVIVPLLVIGAGAALVGAMRGSEIAKFGVVFWVAGLIITWAQDIWVMATVATLDASFDPKAGLAFQSLVEWLELSGDLLTYGLGTPLLCMAMMRNSGFPLGLALFGFLAGVSIVLYRFLAATGISEDTINLAALGIGLVMIWQMAFGTTILVHKEKDVTA